MYKGDHKRGEIEVTQKNIVFKNEYATLYNDDVIFPSGVRGKYLRFVWNAPYGVIIFPRDSEGRLLLVKNFRHENRAWSWEVPKGFGGRDLTPLECSKKELLEETGCTGNNWSLFKTVIEKESKTFVFQVEVESQTSINNQENKEAIAEVRFFSKNELRELLLSDEVNDPMTMFFISHSLSTEV